MLKKAVALLLALVLALSLAACGGKSAPVEDKTPTQSGESTENTGDSQETQTPNDAQSSEDAQGPEFHRGTVEGSTYTSDFFGLMLTLDDNWIIANDEQLAQLGGLVADTFDDETFKKQMEGGSTVYDLYCLNQTDNSSINITVQDLGSLGGIMMNEETYADASLKGLPEVLASAGINVANLEKTTLDFAGSSRTALKLDGTTGDVSLYETMVFVKNSSYIACITAASYDEAVSPADLLALFRAL